MVKYGNLTSLISFLLSSYVSCSQMSSTMVVNLALGQDGLLDITFTNCKEVKGTNIVSCYH